MSEPVLRRKVISSSAEFLTKLALAEQCRTPTVLAADEIVRRYLQPISTLGGATHAQISAVVGRVAEELSDERLIAVPVHGDFNPTNVFCDRQSGKITGVIDWDAAELDGLPLVDLLHFLRGSNEAFRQQPIGHWLIQALSREIWSEWEVSKIKTYLDELSLDYRLIPILAVLYWARHISLHIRFGGTGMNEDWKAANLDAPLQWLAEHWVQ
jgi:aminoglycoside phosphotransferase (APT) family kinase protein